MEIKARSKSQISRRRIILLAVFLVLLAGFLGRGYIRNTKVRKMVNATYGHSLGVLFDKTFEPVNIELNKAGIPVHKQSSHQSTPAVDVCYSATYTGLRETITCDLGEEYNIVETPERLSLWKQQLPLIDNYLRTHGWRIAQGEANTVLGHLFDMPRYARAAKFVSQKQKSLCEIQIYYVNVPRQEEPYELSIFERCRREVEFFGGNQELYSPGLF